VTLCHFTHSASHPYTSEVTSFEGALLHLKDEADVVPPFTTGGVQYPGQNLSLLPSGTEVKGSNFNPEACRSVKPPQS
jgi:hypothetical protein